MNIDEFLQDKDLLNKALKCKYIDEFKNLIAKNNVVYSGENKLNEAWGRVKSYSPKAVNFDEFLKDQNFFDKSLKCRDIDEFKKFVDESDVVYFKDEQLKKAWSYVKSYASREDKSLDDGSLDSVAGGGEPSMALMAYGCRRGGKPRFKRTDSPLPGNPFPSTFPPKVTKIKKRKKPPLIDL